jgi:hypothetical protein
VRLGFRMLVGAVRYSVLITGLLVAGITALVRRYRARQLRQNSSVGDPAHCAIRYSGDYPVWDSELARYCSILGHCANCTATPAHVIIRT